MSKVQQEVIIYKTAGFTTAQRRFEKDLKERQSQWWRLISVTPTQQRGGSIIQLTAIYERGEITNNSVSRSGEQTTEAGEIAGPMQPENLLSLNKPYKEGVVSSSSITQQLSRSSMRDRWRHEMERSRAWLAELERTDPAKAKRQKRMGYGCAALFLLLVIGAAIQGVAQGIQDSEVADTPTSVVTLSQKNSSTVKPGPTSTPKPTPKPTPTPRPTPTPVPYAHFGDGTFIVGKDIQPGTYRTRTASFNCYYARLQGFGGTIGDIIANNNTRDPAVVTIAPTDAGFQSSGCGTWTKDLSPITTNKTSFGDGMYIVGTDIQPDTYKSSGQSGCYYARLSGFGGTVDNIIANDNTDAPAIVTISADDAGFQSNNCGNWTKE